MAICPPSGRNLAVSVKVVARSSRQSANFLSLSLLHSSVARLSLSLSPTRLSPSFLLLFLLLHSPDSKFSLLHSPDSDSKLSLSLSFTHLIANFPFLSFTRLAPHFFPTLSPVTICFLSIRQSPNFFFTCQSSNFIFSLFICQSPNHFSSLPLTDIHQNVILLTKLYNIFLIK